MDFFSFNLHTASDSISRVDKVSRKDRHKNNFMDNVRRGNFSVVFYSALYRLRLAWNHPGQLLTLPFATTVT